MRWNDSFGSRIHSLALITAIGGLGAHLYFDLHRQDVDATRRVEAQEFVLIDKDGKARVKLGFSTLGYSDGDDPWLEFFSESGDCLLRVGVNNADPGVWLGNEKRGRVSLSGGAPLGLSIYDREKHERVRLRLENGNEPDLGFLDPKGNVMAEIHTGPIAKDATFTTRMRLGDGLLPGGIVAEAAAIRFEAGPRCREKFQLEDKLGRKVLGFGLASDGTPWAEPSKFEDWSKAE